MLGPQPQLALSVEFLYEILFVGPQPQLALSVEFLSEILYVGAPILNYMENFYVLIIQWLYVKKV